jgi:ornithine carbamoyltransferase
VNLHPKTIFIVYTAGCFSVQAFLFCEFLRSAMTKKIRHFLDIKDIDAQSLRAMIDRARDMKTASKAGKTQTNLLAGKQLAMIFEKPSTRTRVSFEVGMVELGGHPIHLTSNDLQIGRGESIADTARVLSRYVDGIMMRANAHGSLVELAEYADVPIINGLTDVCHPCQIMADILTIEERLGNITGKTVAWVGDGNNVASSLITAAVKFNFTLKLATPFYYAPNQDYMEWAKDQRAGAVSWSDNPEEAVAGADVVVTDTWVSMGDEAEHAERLRLLTPYRVDAALMSKAAKHAIFLHCLPAHRGEEVTEDVIDGVQSAVWDEAENRLHAQKAVMVWCMAE